MQSDLLHFGANVGDFWDICKDFGVYFRARRSYIYMYIRWGASLLRVGMGIYGGLGRMGALCAFCFFCLRCLSARGGWLVFMRVFIAQAGEACQGDKNNA